MNNDPDIECFLELSGAYMNIEGLARNWEQHFVDGVAGLKIAAWKRSFHRGFAKALLGQLTANEYDKATGWDFDTEEEFQAHLKKYWQMFYGDDKPEDVLAANTG